MMLMDGLGLGEPLKQQKNNLGELENSNNQNYLIVAHHITTFFCCCQTLKHLYVIFHTHSNQLSYSIIYCYFKWLTPKYIFARGILNTTEPQIYLGLWAKSGLVWGWLPQLFQYFTLFETLLWVNYDFLVDKMIQYTPLDVCYMAAVITH